MWALEELILIGALMVASILDIRTHRIPNWLTYSLLVFGLSYALVLGGPASLFNHFLGLIVAGAPFLILFMSGSLGGGDVKLMSAVGAVLGFPLALNALISAIMVGGLCALLILIWQGRIPGMAKYSWNMVWYKIGLVSAPPAALPEHNDAFPFGIAIAVGTCLIMIPPEILQAA